MALLIDLACETRDVDYFRSQDPVEASGLVVSDEAALLWGRARQQIGLERWARLAAPQLIRWESPYGWTRFGTGRTAGKERQLADVVAALLPVPDAWVTFAAAYLTALDDLSASPGHRRDAAARGDALAQWHGLLLDRLGGHDDGGGALLDRIVAHRALGGRELTALRARLADRRGCSSTAPGGVSHGPSSASGTTATPSGRR